MFNAPDDEVENVSNECYITLLHGFRASCHEEMENKLKKVAKNETKTILQAEETI